MFFAFDLPSPTLVSQIMEALKALRDIGEERVMNVFVLVDHAFDEDFLSKVVDKKFPRLSLYEATPLQGFADASPILVQITKMELIQATLERIAHAAGHQPMWSVIASTLDLSALALHFSPFMIARTEDGLEWPVRWSDTRVLPALMEAYEPEVLGNLLSPIQSWLAPTRKGELVSWKGMDRCNSRTIYQKCVPLSDLTFATLVNAAEADAVLAQIHDRQPELLRSRTPSAIYGLISRQLEIANKFHVDDVSIRHHLAGMALYMRSDFTDSNDFLNVIKRIEIGSDYMAEIKALPSDFWEDYHI
jgi:hypothetical protein